MTTAPGEAGCFQDQGWDAEKRLSSQISMLYLPGGVYYEKDRLPTRYGIPTPNLAIPGLQAFGENRMQGVRVDGADGSYLFNRSDFTAVVRPASDGGYGISVSQGRSDEDLYPDGYDLSDYTSVHLPDSPASMDVAQLYNALFYPEGQEGPPQASSIGTISLEENDMTGIEIATRLADHMAAITTPHVIGSTAIEGAIQDNPSD